MNRLVAILGPSKSGKSTIINNLIDKYQNRYEYIKPYTTRELRENETDKIHLDTKQFHEKMRKGDILLPNHIYENWYGPPIKEMTKETKKIKLIDWPVQKLDDLIKAIPETDVTGVYIMPDSINTLMERQNKRNMNEERKNKAIEEMKDIYNNKYENIDYIVENNSTINNITYRLNNIIRGYKNDNNNFQ
ncbi:MAG: GTPase [Nanobdellota archaeon]